MTCYTCFKKYNIEKINTVETVNAKYLLCDECLKVFEFAKEIIKQNEK